MTPSSPTVWRRWLALELVRLRKETGLDQRAVAKAMRCTVAKVSYYENAERPVVLRDLDEVLLPLYNVPEDHWTVYIDAAKNSRQRGWWERYEKGTIPPWFSLFVGLEQGASEIRVYEGQVIPGLLQTEEYAEALARRGTAERGEEEITRHVEVRIGRQAALDREPDPLRMWAVVDEAALRRVIGGPEVMRRQLLHLAEMTGRPKTTLQVVPFANGAYPGLSGHFELLRFPWPTDPGLVYVEHRGGALYLEEPDEIEAHSVAFQHICALALSPTESAAMIRAIAEEHT